MVDSKWNKAMQLLSPDDIEKIEKIVAQDDEAQRYIKGLSTADELEVIEQDSIPYITYRRFGKQEEAMDLATGEILLFVEEEMDHFKGASIRSTTSSGDIASINAVEPLEEMLYHSLPKEMGNLTRAWHPLTKEYELFVEFSANFMMEHRNSKIVLTKTKQSKVISENFLDKNMLFSELLPGEYEVFLRSKGEERTIFFIMLAENE